MKRELQERAFDRSPYERPHQTWVCGWAREGRPCPLGPDRRGRCVVTAQCSPRFADQRWHCTRSRVHGGPCADGPCPDGSCALPIPRCQPVRSLRARRGRFSRWTVATGIGLVVLAIGGAGGARFLSPGPLATPHGTLEGTCESCHSAGAEGPGHWFGAAFAAAPGVEESRLCTACHHLGDESLRPHGLAQDALRAKSARAEHVPTGPPPALVALAGLGPGVPTGAAGALACATCHEEHRGRRADLKALDDRQCQVCHRGAFQSFSAGHPPFEDYPYARRTRIRFDHATHEGKHFPEKDRAFACTACHLPEPTGDTMDVAAFETSCGSCHRDDVRGALLRSGEKGVAFLSFPSLDLRVLDGTEGLPLGAWPRSRRVDPSPFADLLLSDEELTPRDRATLAELDLEKLARAEPEERDAAVRYAWALKGLLVDLAEEGHAGLEARLARAAGRALDETVLTQLAGGLPRDVVAGAVGTWVPHLAEEVALYRDVTAGLAPGVALEGEALARLRDGLAEIAARAEQADPPRSPSDRALESWVDSGGWFRQDRGTSIRYRSRGHADPFLRAWISLAASATPAGPAPAQDSPASRIFQELTSSGAPGRCAKCHSAEAAPGSPAGGGPRAVAVQWQPHRPAPTQHPATQFRHEPHFSLEDEGRCGLCHALEPKPFGEATERFEASYAGFDPASHYESNFRPMEASLCATCHTGEAAGDACVSCHNYHLGDFVPLFLTGTPAGERDRPRSDEDG